MDSTLRNEGVSIAEFNNLQEQFLELRKQNYELIELTSKKEKEIVQLCANLKQSDADARARRQDAEAIALQKREIELLRERLQLQEDEFQLQQLTMQKEVSMLIAKNNELVDSCKLNDNSSPCENKPDDLAEMEENVEQIASLKLQVANLQKALEERGAEMKSKEDQFQQWEAEKDQALRSKSCQLDEAVREKNDLQAVATSRKELLDQMAVYIEQLKRDNELTIEKLKSSCQVDVARLNDQNASLQAELADCDSLRQTASGLNCDLVEATENILQLKNEIAQREESAKLFETRARAELDELKCKMEQEVDLRSKECEEWKQKYNAVWEELCAAKDLHKSTIEQLKQDHTDKSAQTKASQHRQHSIIQDLKKQLRLETRRADRLQEKLSEILKDLPGYQKRDDGKDPLFRLHGDSGSNSSWSLVSGQKGEFDKFSVTYSDHDSLNSMTVLENEIQELIDKVAMLKQNNAELNEKVVLLEESSSKLCEDLSSKNAMIERLLRDRRSIVDGPNLNPKSLLEMLRIDLFDKDLRSMNKKLQRVLEETLTKNVYLQKNIETLSEELMRLSSAKEK